MIKGLLFDKDGTLFDFEATWTKWVINLFDALAKGDDALISRLGDALGFDYQSGRFAPGSPIIAATMNELAELIHAVVPAHSVDSMLTVINDSAKGVPLVEPVPLVPLLEGLVASGFKIGLATNDGEVPARAHLKQAGITRFFDMIMGCDSGFGGKPAPGMCLAFADAMDLPPGQIAMIGDSLHDLDAGRAAGMVTIGVLTGPATRVDLEPHADHVLDDIGELPVFLTRFRAEHTL